MQQVASAIETRPATKRMLRGRAHRCMLELMQQDASAIEIRPAIRADLGEIVALLAADPLGARREVAGESVDSAYVEAFAAIERDPNQLLVVAVERRAVVACAQLSLLPGLSRRGMWRGQIEGVRVRASRRGGGLGRRLLGWAIDECERRGCGLVQLTSDKSRPDAIRFYESLGFEPSHEGLKLEIIH